MARRSQEMDKRRTPFLLSLLSQAPSTMPSSCAMPTFVTFNRSFIRIEKSDGDPSMLPDVESSSVPQLEDASEKVNYLEEADDHTMKRWLTKIGTYLAYRDGEGWDRSESFSSRLSHVG